jgi:hypothetical protein
MATDMVVGTAEATVGATDMGRDSGPAAEFKG